MPRFTGQLGRMLLPIVIFFCTANAGWADPPCTPRGFTDTPHPAIAPIEQLVSHTEEVIVNKPLDAVLADADHHSLSQSLKKADSLPGVVGESALTSIPFPEPGARRVVCLTDGGTTEEQSLLRTRTKTTAEFRYIVWNYTTPKARPVLYGVGDFQWTDLGDGRTRVRWTYSFQLRRDRFPGFLGSFGDYLFRVTFLDRDYAQMMRRTLGKE